MVKIGSNKVNKFINKISIRHLKKHFRDNSYSYMVVGMSVMLMIFLIVLTGIYFQKTRKIFKPEHKEIEVAVPEDSQFEPRIVIDNLSEDEYQTYQHRIIISGEDFSPRGYKVALRVNGEKLTKGGFSAVAYTGYGEGVGPEYEIDEKNGYYKYRSRFSFDVTLQEGDNEIEFLFDKIGEDLVQKTILITRITPTEYLERPELTKNEIVDNEKFLVDVLGISLDDLARKYHFDKRYINDPEWKKNDFNLVITKIGKVNVEEQINDLYRITVKELVHGPTAHTTAIGYVSDGKMYIFSNADSYYSYSTRLMNEITNYSPYLLPESVKEIKEVDLPISDDKLVSDDTNDCEGIADENKTYLFNDGTLKINKIDVAPNVGYSVEDIYGQCTDFIFTGSYFRNDIGISDFYKVELDVILNDGSELTGNYYFIQGGCGGFGRDRIIDDLLAATFIKVGVTSSGKSVLAPTKDSSELTTKTDVAQFDTGISIKEKSWNNFVKDTELDHPILLIKDPYGYNRVFIKDGFTRDWAC